MINLAGLILTIIAFEFSKKLKLKKIPPMVITTLIILAVLYLCKIDYKIYNNSACILTNLLGPATIALALPLSNNAHLLTKNKRAVYSGFLLAVAVAIITTVLLGKMFHSDWNLITSLIPKTVTTPIAVEISKSIGGIPELTACMVVLTGIFGAVFGHKILKIFKIKSDTTIGLAIGASSHVLGTSSCVEKKRETQVVMATIALIVIGILTTIVCTCLF